MTVKRLTSLLLMGLWLVGAPASAERLSRPVSDVTVAEDARGGSQVLFRWDSPLPAGAAVRKAVLRFDRTGERVPRTVTLRVYPITAPWTDGRGAVVFDADVWSYARVDLSQAGPVVVDVTTVVKEVVEGGMRAHGYLVAVDGRGAQGLSPVELARLAGLSTASMDVTWRRLPPVRTRG